MPGDCPGGRMGGFGIDWYIIIIFIEETFSQTWFSKRTSEIKIKTNKCKRTKNMKFIKHLN